MNKAVVEMGNVNTLPANYGTPECGCWHCRGNRGRAEKERLVINHGARKEAGRLGVGEVNRVRLPGDLDYVGVVC